jgi:hypothetical protein
VLRQLKRSAFRPLARHDNAVSQLLESVGHWWFPLFLLTGSYEQ